MVNNFEKIKQFLLFKEDSFYFVQVIRRRKDQGENDAQKSNNIVIKDYFIKSLDHYEKVSSEIKTMCDAFGARAYIRLNKCYWKPVAFEVLRCAAEYMQQGNFSNLKSAFSTACGRRCYDEDKKWIIDIDDKQTVDYGGSLIQSSLPDGNKILGTIETVNGYHLIVKPFDKREYEKKYRFDIHKNNPTLLYSA